MAKIDLDEIVFYDILSCYPLRFFPNIYVVIYVVTFTN